MKIALIDNGSLEPAAHRQLRAAAAALTAAVGIPVAAVSWKHSDRIAAGELDGLPAWTLAPWVRRQHAAGEGEFLFVPFFISPQGAIGSALRRDLAALATSVGAFSARFTPGLADAGVLAPIVAERVAEVAAARGLRRPAVIVVDHGGPSPASARLRDDVTAAVRDQLGDSAARVAAASMESPAGDAFAFNRPLLSDLLAAPAWDDGDVVIAPLFLAPGRHAGPGGDLAQIAAAHPAPGRRCHFAGLVGTHPLAIRTLSANLVSFLSAPVHP
jgi:hypothetical protein